MSDATIRELIMNAAEIAKESLQPTEQIIIIKGITGRQIVINEVGYSNGEHRILVFTNDKKILYEAPHLRYRAIIFENCENAEIFSMIKMLKITFMNCSSSKISLRESTIGVTEFLRCKDCMVNIMKEIPIIQVDLSTNIVFYQRVSEIVYVVCSNVNITGVVVDSGSDQVVKNITIHSSLFGEQTFVVLSAHREIVAVDRRYILNNIEQHLLFLEPDDMDETLGDYIQFGSPIQRNIR